MCHGDFLCHAVPMLIQTIQIASTVLSGAAIITTAVTIRNIRNKNKALPPPANVEDNVLTVSDGVQTVTTSGKSLEDIIWDYSRSEMATPGQEAVMRGFGHCGTSHLHSPHCRTWSQALYSSPGEVHFEIDCPGFKDHLDPKDVEKFLES